MWFRQIRALQDRFNVLVLDLRGHGLSATLPPPPGGYSLPLFSEDIRAVLDDAGIDRAHFAGLSLGTIVVAHFASAFPERVRTVMQVGAIVAFNPLVQLFIAFGKTFQHVVPFYWLYQLFAWIVVPHPAGRAARQVFIREASKLSNEEFLRWFGLTAHFKQFLDRFRQSPPACPIHHLMGEQDYLLLRSVQRFCSTHPQAMVHILPACGHICNLEQPHRFNALFLQLLTAASALPPSRIVALEEAPNSWG